MFKKTLLISVSAALLYSCGSKSSSNSGGPGTTTPTNTITYSNPGPSSCLTNSLSYGAVTPYYENFHEALATPFKINLARQHTEITIHPSQQKNQNKNFQIINGDTAGTTTNCKSSTSSPSAKTIVTTNTVAIVIPVPSSTSSTLCTGALVGDGAGGYLVLTAAHCFNGVTDFTSKTAGGAVVYFDNASTIINSTNYTAVSCWQRHPNYRAPSSTDTDVTKNLFDIAWIKLADTVKINSQSFAITPVLATPSQITATAEKLFAGFGAIIDGGSSDGYKRCVTTTGTTIDTNYATRGDITPLTSSGATAISSYDTLAANMLGATLVGTTAFESYLTVIGPINGSNFGNKSSGTCFGDSGGPVYIRSGSQWILSALTEGADSLLTPHPIIDFTTRTSATGLNAAANFNTSTSATCADGYGTYTTLGNYISWLKSSSGITVTSQ